LKTCSKMLENNKNTVLWKSPHAISRVKVVGMQSGLIEPEVSSIPHQIPQDVEQVLIDAIRGLRLERKGQCQCVDALEKAGLQ